MFYLKKMICIFENSSNREAVDMLVRKLQKEGVGVLCFWTEDMGIRSVTAEAVIDAAWTLIMHEQHPELCGNGDENGGNAGDKNGRKGMEQLLEMIEMNMSEEAERLAASLWMTDIGELAGVLRQLEQPVLALLHEHNKNQDFSAALHACENPEELDADYMDRVYRRYKRLPWEILETDRCRVRETVVEDVDAFFEIYKEPAITRYTEGIASEKEQEIQYINDYIDHFYGFYNFGVWTVMKKDTGEIIGRAGLSCREGYEEPEIGFVIGLPWQRQGYAEEICRAILRYAFEELEFPVIQAFVRTENEASLALCQKLGMEKVDEVVWEGELYWRLQMVYGSAKIFEKDRDSVGGYESKSTIRRNSSRK